jgi:uncharacterized membrane protein YjfL (UPF0719 family)
MKTGIRWVFALCAAASVAMIAVALHRWGAAEVRADPGEVFWLTLAGGIWLIVTTKLFAWLGLSFRDDALERRNVAALAALCGGLLAVALIYTGGSLGEGPSYLDNFFCAALGTFVLFALWVLLELAGKVSVSIAEERDLASGLRLCGFLLGAGLVLARALAGDWDSAAATVHDLLRDGWPAALLCILALAIELIARPSRRLPFPPWRAYGLVPALGYLALASAWLVHLGAWEGMP